MSTPLLPVRLPLLVPAVAAWVGAFAALAWSPRTAAWAAGLLVGAAAALAWAGWRRPAAALPGAAAVTAALTAIVLGLSAAVVADQAAGPLPGWAARQVVATVEGRVTVDPHPVRSAWPGPPLLLLTVDLTEVSARGVRAPTHGRLLVLAATGGPGGVAAWAPAVVGARVRLVGRLAPPRTRGPEVATLRVGRPPTVLAPPAAAWRLAEQLRAGLRAAVEGASPDAAGLLPALVVGDTSALPADLEQALRACGLTHLTAVSGANLAIVLAVVLGAALLLRVPRGARVAGGVVTVVAFVVVARPEPSVLRAAAMGSVALLGLWSGRGARGLHALSVTVAVLLVVDPWLARSAGFALSVLATGALLTLAPRLADALPRRWPRPARLALAVPIAAQLVTTPVVLLLQPGVSLVGVPANLLAAPAVVVATVSGAAATALAPAALPVARVAALPGLVAAGGIGRLARLGAAVPGGVLPWPQGRAGALAAVLVAVAAVLVTLALAARPARARAARRARRAQWAVRRHPAPRRPTLVGLGLCTAALAVAVGWFGAPRLPAAAGGSWPPAGWMAVQCDVGQGAATVVPTTPGHAVLVDAGPVPELVDGCLARLGVSALDLVVLTHFHADHVLGLPGALRGRAVGPVLVSPFAEPAENAAQVRRWLSDAGVSATPVWAGGAGSAGADGVVRWRTLWPVPPLPVSASGDRGDGEEGSVVNEASVVTLLEVAGRVVVSLGDLEEAGQAGVLRALPADLRPVDVVVVAHHGSARQLPGLYARLRPAVALFGVGVNDYGHPAPRTLALLADVGAAVLRTDTAGDAAVVVTGRGLATAVRP